ncbi:MAG: HD domain-containing protein [Candidatus Krumholzibacteriota bacterium]|nr:HD domain-containing protein [Candidatus Krumholzibacteriota bacterium]
MDEKKIIEIGREHYNWEYEILRRGELYLVGGVVRNLLFGFDGESLDTDYLVRGIELNKLVTILDKYGRTDLVGKSFGVIKFTPEGGKTVDIAMPRTEHSTGIGHKDFEVYANPRVRVEDDLVRRDFTINSIALNLKNMSLIDPLEGSKDIKNNLLRVNREGSFAEDPLRMIRGVQFLCRFNLKIDLKTRRYIEHASSMIESVSGERLKDEFNKLLLLSKEPGRGFIFMKETGLLSYLIPELEETFGVEQNEYHPDDIFYHSIKSCNIAPQRLNVRWSALLHDLGKKSAKMKKAGRIVFYGHENESQRIAKDILTRFRYSKRFTANVCHLIKNHMFNITEDCKDSTVRRFVSRVGVENLDDLFALREADALSRGDTDSAYNVKWLEKRIEYLIKADSALATSDLEIDGYDIMRLTGLKRGPRVGEILNDLLQKVIENPDFNTRRKLSELAVEEYRKRKI